MEGLNFNHPGETCQVAMTITTDDRAALTAQFCLLGRGGGERVSKEKLFGSAC
jgi:hypothetical protein